MEKEIAGKKVRELRCRKCRAFITYERVLAGYILHQCSKCGYLNTFEFRFMPTKGMYAMIKENFTIKPLKGGEK